MKLRKDWKRNPYRQSRRRVARRVVPRVTPRVALLAALGRGGRGGAAGGAAGGAGDFVAQLAVDDQVDDESALRERLVRLGEVAGVRRRRVDDQLRRHVRDGRQVEVAAALLDPVADVAAAVVLEDDEQRRAHQTVVGDVVSALHRDRLHLGSRHVRLQEARERRARLRCRLPVAHHPVADRREDPLRREALVRRLCEDAADARHEEHDVRLALQEVVAALPLVDDGAPDDVELLVVEAPHDAERVDVVAARDDGQDELRRDRQLRRLALDVIARVLDEHLQAGSSSSMTEGQCGGGHTATGGRTGHLGRMATHGGSPGPTGDTRQENGHYDN